MAVMTNVSRPLIGLLVATVAFFAVWIAALKPTSSHSGGTSSAPFQSAINKAKQAVATSNAESAAHGGTVASTSPPTAKPITPKAVTHAPSIAGSTGSSARTAATASSKHASAANRRLSLVEAALREKKVVAVLFYNSAATDDQAVRGELSAVPAHGGRVVKVAVPLTELGNYAVLTNQVPINESPTLVIVNRAGQAKTIVGFADTLEIEQRIADALAGQ